MKIAFLITCLSLTSALLGFERGDFDDNHVWFITKHLPNLLDHASGKCLLLGTSDPIDSRLCKQFPFIEFEKVSLWNKHLWGESIKENNWTGIFDCVIAVNILEREPNREQIIQMIFDLLKLRGTALIYVDPQDKNTFDQRSVFAIVHSEWKERIPIMPSLSLAEHQLILEKIGFHVLDQSPDEYKIYFPDNFSAFLSVAWFVCPRWPVPRREWDEELFSGKIRDSLNFHHEITKVPNAPPIFNRWIEDNFQTHYFIVQK